MISGKIIAATAVVGVVGILVVGGLVFVNMVRSANDRQAELNQQAANQQAQLNQQAAITKYNACAAERNQIEANRATLNAKVFGASNAAWHDFNVELDSYNARCANETTNFAAQGPQP